MSISFLPKVLKKRVCLFLLLASLLLLHDLLDNLLLLDQESADDSVADAVTASGTTVGSLDGLLGLGDLSVLAGAESGDLNGDICQLLVFLVVVVVEMMFRSREGESEGESEDEAKAIEIRGGHFVAS